MSDRTEREGAERASTEREGNEREGAGRAPTEGGSPDAERARRPADVPTWDDEYLDRVSDRLMHNYDLEREYRAGGKRFAMYGEMRIVSQKHFLHPALSYARHEAREHLLVTRIDRVAVADLERLVELGHDLADEWIDADEDHFGTDLTFVVVADAIPDEAREFVDGFRDRNLIKLGYHGHYEVHLVVVAPDDEESVASEEADVEAAFRLWESLDEGGESRGLLGRLFG